MLLLFGDSTMTPEQQGPDTDISGVHEENKILLEELKQLKKQNAALLAQNQDLKVRLGELELLHNNFATTALDLLAQVDGVLQFTGSSVWLFSNENLSAPTISFGLNDWRAFLSSLTQESQSKLNNLKKLCSAEARPCELDTNDGKKLNCHVQVQENNDIVLYIKDVTAARDNQMLLESLKLQRFLDQFISSFTHDLRTPLSVILTSVTMLSNYSDMLTSSVRETKFNNIISAVNTITFMLDRYLLFKKVSSPNEYSNKSTISFISIVDRLNSFFQERIEIMHQEQVAINLNVIPVLIDVALKELLTNSINAEATKIFISASGDGSNIEIIIKDDGIGIDQSEIGNIFDLLTIHDDSRTERNGDLRLGIGLPIVQQIIKGHGGNITVVSEMGKGTTFTITLPLLPKVEEN